MSLTAEHLRDILFYDPLTGVFLWRVATTNRVKVGARAGHPEPKHHGYRLIGIDGRVYHAGRLAVLYMTGEMPPTVDHKNMDRGDDRWENLRQATYSQNNMNRTKQRNNKSGFKGVHFHPPSGKWRARISVGRKQKSLGLHVTPELAHVAYSQAAERLHGEFARVK